MQTANNFDRTVQTLLEVLGGEPLVGSGFEGEEPLPEYSSVEEE